MEWKQLAGVAVFTGLALVLGVVGSWIVGDARRVARLKQAYPDQPWMWRGPVEPARIPGATSGALPFALGCGALCLVFVVAGVGAAMESSDDWFAAGAAIVAGAVGIWAALYVARSVTKYGRVVLHLAQVPVAPGGMIEARLFIPRDPYRITRFTVHLRRYEVRKNVSGSKKHETEKLLWEATYAFDQADLGREPGSHYLPISVQVPRDQPKSSEKCRWKLEIQGEAAGVDLKETFEIPVHDGYPEAE